MSDAMAVMVRGLRVWRQQTLALAGLDLEIGVGQMVGLLGPSGCGKSTLMRSLVGVQIITEGTVEVFGLPAGDEALRSRVGYVTQQPSVYADLTVQENLTYFARIFGRPMAVVDLVIEQVDLVSKTGTAVRDLSGGERSRVSLAAALVGQPDLLILDEPTVGLDPVLRRDLWALFRSLAAEGKTLLISSHVMDEAVHCDRLLLMRQGQLLADATLPQILAQTGEADVEAAFLALVDQANLVPDEVTRQPTLSDPSPANSIGLENNSGEVA